MTEKPYRIIIEGVGTQNKGSQAMAVTAQQYIEANIPNAKCYVLSDTPLRTRQFREIGIGVIETPSNWKYKKLVNFFKSLLLGKHVTRPADVPCEKTWFPYDYCDAVVDASGFSSSDQHGMLAAVIRMIDCMQVRATGKPVIYWSQSWGPFRNPVVRFSTRWILKATALVVAREKTSFEYLKELNLPETCQIIHAPDMAFHFQADSKDVGKALLEKMGCRFDGSPIVGVTPNLHVYWRTAGKGPENEYVKHMIAITRHFLNKGVQVAVMPHLISADDSYPDDRILCRYICDAIGEHPNLSVMLEDATAKALKAAIGQLDFLATSRYHTIIAAMCMRIPLAVIGWSHKYDDLFESVKLSACCVSCKNNSTDKILETVEACWNNRDDIRRKLEENVPALEKASMCPLDIGIEILKKHREANA